MNEFDTNICKRERANTESYLDQIESGDAIVSIWDIDDVMNSIEEDHPEFTRKEGREILARMLDGHDCNYGWTWDDITCYANDIAREKLNDAD